ncbi:hypothetical protein G6F22_015677 [Rhizopus arrhizus]|nr:hypothetical protein G6F22_015677 [Rhizopus arrhizus]
MVEALRQLTGTAGGTQVADARIGMVSGFGMINYDRGLQTAPEEPGCAYPPAHAAARLAQPQRIGADRGRRRGPFRPANLRRLRRGAIPAPRSLRPLPVRAPALASGRPQRRAAGQHHLAPQHRPLFPRTPAVARGHRAHGRRPLGRGPRAPGLRRRRPRAAGAEAGSQRPGRDDRPARKEHPEHGRRQDPARDLVRPEVPPGPGHGRQVRGGPGRGARPAGCGLPHRVPGRSAGLEARRRLRRPGRRPARANRREGRDRHGFRRTRGRLHRRQGRDPGEHGRSGT